MNELSEPFPKPQIHYFYFTDEMAWAQRNEEPLAKYPKGKNKWKRWDLNSTLQALELPADGAAVKTYCK